MAFVVEEKYNLDSNRFIDWCDILLILTSISIYLYFYTKMMSSVIQVSGKEYKITGTIG
jgi:hypothetical protein